MHGRDSLIFGGWGRKVKPRGEVFFICPSCRGLAVFGLFENYGYAQVYGVRIAKAGTKRLIVCSRCRAGYELSRANWDHAKAISAHTASVPDLRGGHIRTAVLALAAVLAPDQVDAIDRHLRINMEDPDVGAILLPAPTPVQHQLREFADPTSLIAGKGPATTVGTPVDESTDHVSLMAGKGMATNVVTGPREFADPTSLMTGKGAATTVETREVGSAIGLALRAVMPQITADDAATSQAEIASENRAAEAPEDLDGSTLAGVIGRELKALDQLRQNGVIDDEEYRALRKRVLEG
jgi:hypothetical protein